MKKSLIMKIVKFMQNPNYMNHSVHAKPAQSDYVRSTVGGGGGENLKLLKGFTLAEVLITLGIIGIVAALTLPVLNTKIRNKQLESSFKAAYSLVSQAVINMSADEYDIVGTYCAGAPESNAEFAKAFSKYFQTIKLFDGTDYVFNKLGYKKPIEQSGDGHFNFNVDGYNNGAFVTKNGMIIAPSGCWWTGKTGVDFIVDTNGNKGPNKFGYDVFYFQINGSNRLVPANLDEHFFNIVSEQSVCCDMEVKSSTCSSNNGTACSHFALKNQYPNDTTKPYWESLR